MPGRLQSGERTLDGGPVGRVAVRGEEVLHRQVEQRAQAAAFAVEALGQEAFDAACAEGRAMLLDDPIALAHEVIDAG